MKRKKFIAGNWKMYTTAEEASALAHGIAQNVSSYRDIDVALCPPYVHLSEIVKIVKGTSLFVGAQDVHWQERGAYTGKVSAEMLTSIGVTHVIIGHSEQRTYFHETNDTVNKKLKTSLACGLFPIVCIGETLQERKNGIMESILTSQITGAFTGIERKDLQTCTIAYEPVWAIGTGETATPSQANEAHAFIRSVITQLYDSSAAMELRIQYGGSLKPENAEELFSQSEVDGGLVGGASLKVESFCSIVKSASTRKNV